MSSQEILANIALRIRQSLHLKEILKTITVEVRQWLEVDRVIIYGFNPDWSGIVKVESVNDPRWSIIGRVITDPCFKQSWLNLYQQGRIKAIDDINADDITPCHREFLQQYQIRANLVVPIILNNQNLTNRENKEQSPLWGLLIAHQCSNSRKWRIEELNLLERLSIHIAIAIQQAQLLEQLQQTNQALIQEISERKKIEDQLQQTKTELENRVIERTDALSKANEQLQQLNNELAQSNQELEQFAYVASHDLREPLRMVSSFTKLLAQRYSGQLDDEADTIINFAVDGAARMEILINDLLTYSRVGTYQQSFQKTNCQIVLEETLSHLELLVQETSAVVKSSELPTVRGDKAQLVQLFQNLIDNAIKYHSSEVPQIKIGAQFQDDRWLFRFQDNGIGIEPKHHKRIFQIFQRLHTRQQYSGTGIGLAICQKIVECHGGEIWVESELGKGSTFYFTLLEQEPD